MRRNPLAALCLATLCLAPGLARAQGKSVSEIPVKVEIDDSFSGAAVTSDGGGAYVNGMGGVYARILTSSGDLLIDFDSTAARHLWMNWSYDVTNAVTATCTSPLRLPLVWPSTEPFFTRPGVSFDSIGLLATGESRLLGVVFTTPYGRARLKHRVNSQNDYCAGNLSVTCLQYQKQWLIQSPQNSNPGASHDGIAVILQDFSTSTKRNTTPDMQPVRYVNLPFKITVTALP